MGCVTVRSWLWIQPVAIGRSDALSGQVITVVAIAALGIPRAPRATPKCRDLISSFTDGRALRYLRQAISIGSSPLGCPSLSINALRASLINAVVH